MGCCVSRDNHNKVPPTISNSSQQSEEETVKEVLSETPTIPKKSSPVSYFPNTMEQKHHNDHILKKHIVPNFNHHSHHDHDLSEEVSEICSDTISTTTTLTDERYTTTEDDATEVRQMSPAKYRKGSFQGEFRRNVGSSPARRSDPSPGRVSCGRDPRGLRKDNGECSGRRSRSPTMRTENGGFGSGIGRSPSVRKTGKSPGRVRSELGDRIRKMEERDGNGENKWPPTSENESLENPLVSLEWYLYPIYIQ